jgi:hypothetical protein
MFLGGVLIFGVGLETHEAGCSAGIYLCIVFYASSKLLIYAFLSTLCVLEHAARFDPLSSRKGACRLGRW